MQIAFQSWKKRVNEGYILEAYNNHSEIHSMFGKENIGRRGHKGCSFGRQQPMNDTILEDVTCNNYNMKIEFWKT